MATGGGAVLAPENRKLLHETGMVVYLETSLAQQLQRVGKGSGRPLLKGGDLARATGRAAGRARAAVPGKSPTSGCPPTTGACPGWPN